MEATYQSWTKVTATNVTRLVGRDVVRRGRQTITPETAVVFGTESARGVFEVRKSEYEKLEFYFLSIRAH